MKHRVVIAMLAIVILPVAALAVDSDKFVTSRPQINQTDQLVVPIEISNTQDLVALDIPLSFSEDAVLERVEFTELVGNFDFKIANIQNDRHQVVIGLITMGKKDKPDLKAGSGIIANMYFKLAPGSNSVEITPVELKKPDHTLSYYYNDFSNGYPEVKVIYPEVETKVYSASDQSSAIPDAYGLSQNSPNPFNPDTRMSYSLPEAGHVRLTVFNILGQNVRQLIDDYAEAGTYEVIWDGRDNLGDQVASGVYFYRMDVNDYSETRKMMLLK